MSKLVAYPMFVSPLWIMTYDSHKDEQQSYIDYIEETDREPYNKGFLTGGELHNKTLFQPLVETISLISNTLIETWELEPHMTQLGIQQMWGSCTMPGGLLMPVEVPNSFATGMYFVKTPPNSGNLLIDNPNNNISYYSKMHRKEANEFNVEKFETVTPEGDIIVYPGNLKSMQTTNENINENRYVIYFSLAFVN